MYRLVLILVFSGLVRGGFFDLTDVDDPLALLWNIQSLKEKLTECRIDDNTMGVCMDKAKCMIAGGTPSQKKCGPFFFTCCGLDTTCDKTSDKKVSYFKSGQLSKGVTNCRYTIKLRNQNVCQIRLDFDELILAPTVLTSQTTSVGSAYVFICANDVLWVEPNHYGLPTICGNNTKQHMYIHVNQTTESRSGVNIYINLANRMDPVNQYLPEPKWKIKFTQLECPMKRHKFDLAKYGEVENINNDFYLLAPQGAIQYFTEWKGQIRSFAFNTSNLINTDRTSYPHGMHYTIAFRRPTNVCGLKFTPVITNILVDDPNDSDDFTCWDYLYIPEFYSPSTSTDLSDVKASEEVCIQNDTFYSLVPGPLFVIFKSFGTISDREYYTKSGHLGFIINYELVSVGQCPSISSR